MKHCKTHRGYSAPVGNRRIRYCKRPEVEMAVFAENTPGRWARIKSWVKDKAKWIHAPRT